MKDIIWTIIVLWIVWKIYDALTSVSKARPRTASNSTFNQYNTQQNHYHSNTREKEGSVHVENTAPPKKTHFKADDGEYVDFEDVK